MATTLIGLTNDPLARRQLQRAASELRAELILATTWAEAEAVDHAPAAVVVDLEEDGWDDFVADAKSRWPQTPVAGYLELPDPRRWTEALGAGCDLVTSRGTLARQLVGKVEEWQLDPGGHRIRLFATGDIAGRIGVVARLPDTPSGPLAVYHLGGEILVAEDRCPHAGATLSEGELLADMAVITCPRHGSRFDLRSGERVRGPADDGIATFRVTVEGTEVYVRLDLPRPTA